MDKTAFGKKLRELRSRVHTQDELGDILEVGSKQIQRYENGELLPDHEKVQALCDLYKYDFPSLIYDVPREGSISNDHYRVKYERLLEDYNLSLKQINSAGSSKASYEQEGLTPDEIEMIQIFSGLDSKDRKAVVDLVMGLRAGKQRGISDKKGKLRRG